MAAFWRQAEAEWKLYLRDPVQVFFGFAFPVALVFLFATIYKGQSFDGEIGYIDFIIPGMIAVLTMTTAFFSVGVTVAGYRENGVIRRLRSTSLKPITFFSSVLFVRYLIILLQSAVLIGVAMIAFDGVNHGSWVDFLVMLSVGSLAFLALGFAIASVTKSTTSAVAVANSIFVPLMMVSGAFYPTDSYPQIIKDVVEVFPLYYLIEGMRDVWATGWGLDQVLPAFGFLSAWLAAGVLISVWRFRWE